MEDLYSSFYCHFLRAHNCLLHEVCFLFPFPSVKENVHNVICLLLDSVTNYRMVVSRCGVNPFCTFLFKADICKIKLRLLSKAIHYSKLEILTLKALGRANGAASLERLARSTFPPLVMNVGKFLLTSTSSRRK